jgi:catechol 2,3-dioxygenase-like lactoylglutathione lyase family enzyme
MTDSPRAIGARYGHTNVIARDWRRLAAFYEGVFGCVPVPPERDYSGELLERATAVAGATFRGVHLRLPGGGPDGPTLEIYTYAENVEAGTATANRVGWGHIAFMVDDVEQAREAVLAAGGGVVGDVVTTRTADGRSVTWCYLTDPEGNLVELQSWSPATEPDA